MDFEWNPQKAKINLRKHGVSFEEASTVFRDPLSVTFPDGEHSLGENRYLIIGVSAVNKVLVIAHTYRNHQIRIISAREATKAEKHFYELGH